MQRSGPTANRHFTGSRPQELSIHLGLFSRLLLPLDLLDGFQHLQTWGLFSSFHTTSHAQLPVRIWLTSKCIPKKPTGFISPRPDQNIQRKSLGIRQPYFFFPRSYPYQHFDLVLHLNQNARSKPVDSGPRGVSQIGESSCFSVAVSTRAFQLGSNTFQFFSHYILHCLLHLFPPGGDGLTTARVFFEPCTPPKKNSTEGHQSAVFKANFMQFSKLI